MSVLQFFEKKRMGQKITMMTCYDYTSARIVADTSIDALLVGDSVAMTIHGFKDTVSATVDMMCDHIAAVSRGAGKKMIVGDMPFLSFRQSLPETMSVVQRLMQAGASAIKLEGAIGNEKTIRHIVESGVPVMGHIGLTPQLVHTLGGYKVQGKTDHSRQRLVEEAQALQDAGCFAFVLECVSADVASEITKNSAVPTIGIGAGRETDGQILVWQDVLGLNIDFKPKFVKAFLNGAELFKENIDLYVKAVQSGEFPSDAHCY